MYWKKICRGLLFAMIFLTWSWFAPPTLVQAVPTYDEVLKSAPNGMKLGDLFEYPTSYSGSKTVANPVKILPAGDKSPTDVIQMTDGDDQASAIWGRMVAPDGSDYNYFDISKEQTISGWIYVGPKANVSSDGIALVLQNDANGINSIARYYKRGGLISWLDPEINLPAEGESLGVYGGTGTDKHASTVGNTADLAGKAIQNSFALEFDAFRNASSATSTPDEFNDKGVDDLFDGLFDIHNVSEAKGQHVAWSYPGDKSTYEKYMEIVHYFYGMRHKNVIQNVVISGYNASDTARDGWHHFSFSYKPDENNKNIGYISYVFNDRLTDGSVKPYTTWDKRPKNDADSIAIDLTKFNLPAGETKVRWGFTSSTGSPNSEPGSNAIIMERIPSVIDVTSTNSLYDVTQEHSIKDLDKRSGTSGSDNDYTVGDGDELAFTYDLQFHSGITGTGNITAQMQLPQNVLYQNDENNRIGEITYADDPNSTTYISVSQLTTTKNNNGESVQTLSLDLGALSKNSTGVKVTIYGTANAPNSNVLKRTKVAPEHTSYKSDYYNDDVMSYGFYITNEKLQITPTEETQKQTVKKDADFTLDGLAKYLMSSKFTGDDLTAYGQIFDENGVDTKLHSSWNVPSTLDAETDDYSLAIPAGMLEPGTYKIKVRLADSQGLVSNTVTYDITVTDSELVLTPDETVINVTDNKPVKISGNYKYSDDTDFRAKNATKTYEIKNSDGTIHKITQTMAHDKVIDYSLNPIAYEQPLDQTLSEFLKNPPEENVLKEGKNEVTITVSDGNLAEASATVIVNVPKLSPTITAKSNELTVLGPTGHIHFPIDFDYGSKYTLDNHELIGVFQVDSQTPINLKIDSPITAQNQAFDMSFDLTGNDLKLPTSQDTSVVSDYFTDPYGRKTNTESFNLKILSKALELNFNNYRFETIDPKTFTPGYIERTGDWDLDVTSYKASWKLNAYADNLNYATSGNESDLSMDFVDKNNLATALSNNPQIAKSSDQSYQVVDISDQWNENNGILLKAQSLPIAGDYQGTVYWDLTESIE